MNEKAKTPQADAAEPEAKAAEAAAETTPEPAAPSEPEAPAEAEAAAETEVEPAAEPTDAERLADVEAETAALKDQLLRALAETENVRRRARRERDEVLKFAAAGLARDLVGVADNLRRALDSVPAEAVAEDALLAALKEGVELVEREFLGAFERHGIERIEPLGEKFNHDFHEAMFEVPDTGQPNGTIVHLLEPGYVLRGRLLRAARVGVAKDKATDADEHVVDTTA